MENPVEVRERLNMIKKAILPLKGVKVFHDVPKYAYMQGLFSTGDRRVSKVIEEMQNTGDWIRAAENTGINRDFYIFRKKDSSEIMPWDFIDIGVGKDRLWSEYQEAISYS
jgi:hypothetical protein